MALHQLYTCELQALLEALFVVYVSARELLVYEHCHRDAQMGH